MNNSQEVANRIKTIAKSKNIAIGKMLSDCGLSKNTLSTMQSAGFLPRIENLIKISDYLDCSIDYLLGRNFSNSVTNTVDINTNHGVGQINAPVTIKNGQERVLSKQEQDLLRIYNAVDGMCQIDIMKFIYDIEQKNKRL